MKTKCYSVRLGFLNARIGMELGMDADEVLRLKQITGLAEVFKDRDFSDSWVSEEKFAKK